MERLSLLSELSYEPPPQDLSTLLPYASQAAFNSYDERHDLFCLPDTRVEVREEISAWCDGPEARRIFWLSGMAGTGKSTIARTVARQWYEQNKLGASFFFSRGGGDVGHAGKLFTTIACQLARASPVLEGYICEAIAEHRNIASQTLQEQWNQLVFRPLSKLKADSPHSSLVLVIDALDECEEDGDIQLILQLLAKAQCLEFKRVLFFVTSRLETPIRVGFGMMPEILHHDLALYNVFSATVNRDISKFFQDKFRQIRSDFEELSANWPGDQITDFLVEQADGLFIYAAIVCRFIKGGEQWPPQDFLDLLIRDDCSNRSPEWKHEVTDNAATSKLDEIYSQILNNFVRKTGEGQNTKMLGDTFKQVVGTLLILREPLSTSTLPRLLAVRQEMVDLGVRHLHSVLIIPDSQDSPIRLFHLSFRDFLFDKLRCSDELFRVDEKKAHSDLVNSCLRVMSKLRSDLCCLREPGALASMVGKAEIDRHLSAELQYACCFWVEHLQKSQVQLHDQGPVHIFLREHFLHWLEALSLMKKNVEGMRAIFSLESIAKASKAHHICAFIYDAKEFVLSNRSIIEEAPLQIYCSGRVFASERGFIKEQFEDQIPHWIHELPKVPRYWISLEHTLKGHNGWVRSVVFSPDGSKLASASDDTTIQLWNVTTGKAEQTLKGHTGWVRSIAFFPDGSKLATASGDRTVRLWDIVLRNVTTGQANQVLKDHKDGVNSVAVSSNGKKLASASGDGTIKLWDIATLQAQHTVTGYIVQTLEGHTGGVNSLAFSLSGCELASASDDTTIKLWDTAIGRVKQTFEGHTKGICSVNFSSDGTRITSASGDATVKVWNAITGQVEQTLKDYTYKGWIRSAIFSPNRRKVVSASDDGVIRVWNTTTGQVEQTIKGHMNRVRSITFSPSSHKLASASDDATVRLWNITMGQGEHTLNSYARRSVLTSTLDGVAAQVWKVVPVQVEKTLLKNEIEWVNSISFSRDGGKLASALNNATIRVWNVTSRQAEQILDGHTGGVNSVAFSPNSTNKLASASDDGTILVYDIATGQAEQTLKGHTGWVRKVAFSPDGRKLASASGDATVRVWNATTGQAEQILKGHKDGVRSIAFSLDGSMLASASSDSTIQMWNIATGQPKQTLDSYTSGVNSIAFSPNGSTLASGLGNGTVQIWNIATGQLEQTLHGHTDTIRSVAFSRDGSKLASASVDTTIKIWSAIAGQAEQTLEGHTGPVRSLAFSPDNSKLASASSDGTIWIWNITTWQAEQTIKCYTD